MIGGAPVTRQYAEEIGADAYGEDASVAVSIARSLIAKTLK
jgi:methanogenic corrinoid protein MtbC1